MGLNHINMIYQNISSITVDDLAWLCAYLRLWTTGLEFKIHIISNKQWKYLK